jgi:transglutaminase-like putative cysteine protease
MAQVIDARLRIDVGCEFQYEVAVPTPAIFMVRPESRYDQQLVAERWFAQPDTTYHDYRDLYGNVCRRTVLPPGRSAVRYHGQVETSNELDPYAPDAVAYAAEDLPDDVLIYTLPSRYCVSDLLGDEAWRLFGATRPGWERVQAICDYVNGYLRFSYGTSTPFTTAYDVYQNRVGVCRDFAHLAISFARAMNIPCRYAFGYLPDIDVPPLDAPMDFAAWFEAFLDGRWWTFDPRNNVRRRGRAVIARGRDALDVAMVTTYGRATLHEMTVLADKAA